MTKATLPPAADPFEKIEATGGWIERHFLALQNWVTTHWIEVAIAVVVGAALYLALRWIKRRARAYADARPNDTALQVIAARVVGRTGRFFRIMLSIMLVAGYANTPDKLLRTISFLFTVAAVWQVALWVRELVLNLIERRAAASGGDHDTLENAMALIRILVSFAIFAVAAIVILDNLGVNVTGLVAGLGVGGIAIGLAAQGIFSDLFAALSILFDKPFKRGDQVRFDTMTATVEKIGLKTTRLRALDGQEVIVSNTNLLSKQIENLTRQYRRRTRYQIGVIYQTPADKARALPGHLTDIVTAQGAELVRAVFIGFGPSSIDYELVFDVLSEDQDRLFAVRHAVGMEILALFDREGYDFAYPTQTTFTAAPDGTMVMPYAVPLPASGA